MNYPSTQSTEPVESVDYSTIATLKKSEEALTKDAKELLADWELPLTFTQHPLQDERLRVGEQPWATVKTGILWINGPFKTDFWSKARKKPKLPKCQCTTCGHKHSPPKRKGRTP